MRIRAGLPVLWRGAGVSQIGADPRRAVVLEHLSTGDQRLLERLRHECTPADLARSARTVGITAERAGELVATLTRADVLVAHPGRRVSRAEPGPEEAYWERLTGDGGTVMATRSAARVRVLGLDRLGMTLAMFLATAGVGTLLVEDTSPVTEPDLGVFQPWDLGRSRAAQAVAHLRTLRPGLRTSARDATCDVVVAVFTGVADPVRLRPLVRSGTVHLPVVVGEVDVVVGPLVERGRGPCSRCLDLHHTAADPGWPAVATQLRTSAPSRTDAGLAQVGAALAAHQVLAAVDGREVAVRGATLAANALEPLPVLRTWSVHPDCECAAPTAAEAPAGTRVRV
ncbi:MAG: ThiF family adenylyltransferase [Georgenia sp.]